MGLLNRKKKMEENKIVEKMSWIFSEQENLEAVMQVLCSAFEIQGKGEGNTLTLHNGDLHIAVSVCARTMSDEAREYVEGQVKNVWGHFHEVNTKFIDTKINLLHQLRMTGSVIELSYSYEEDEKLNKELIIWQPFIDSLEALKGVLVAEKGTVILGEKGRLILSDQGASEGEVYMPYERELPDSFAAQGAEESRKRRKQSMEILKSRFIYAPSWLPLLETEEETNFRSAQEIAGRTAALLTVSLYSECLLGEHMETGEARKFVQDVLDRFDAEQYLSPEEKAYLENPDSTEQERIKYSWQYENLLVMEWALGLLKELPFPDHICDVPMTVRVLNRFGSMEELLEHTSPLPGKELLDMADLIFRLDWACVDARVNGLPSPAGMNEGVTVERHKSLNWLIGFDDSAPWDEVDTPT